MNNLVRQHVRARWIRNMSAAASVCLVVSVGSAVRSASPAKVDGMKPAGAVGFSFKRSEKCVMRRINNIRQRHGLRALDRDPQIGYISRLHAITMAGTGSIFHDDNFGNEVTNWTRLGQNTGRGGSCRSTVRAFMHDPPHREIILGAWRHQGVGVHRAGGVLYVQHIFESKADPGNIYHVP